jgi:hypothetical protein
VIQFVIHYGRLGDLQRQAADAVIGEWNDITSWWNATPHAPVICVALDLAPEMSQKTQNARSRRAAVVVRRWAAGRAAAGDWAGSSGKSFTLGRQPAALALRRAGRAAAAASSPWCWMPASW